MGYTYAYGYGIRTGLIASQVYAGSQTQAYLARVAADGGIVQNPTYVYEWYKLQFELDGSGQPLQWRRKYNALGGVKLNNVLGVDYVQTWYDFGTTSDTRVNAVQGTAANQPLWSLDSDTGFRVPLFDGSNDVMSVNDLGIFNAQAAGTMIAVAKDLNRTGGDANHAVCFISNGLALGSSRIALITRQTSTSNFAAIGRRVDADAASSSALASLDGYNFLSNESVWGANLLQLRVNATQGASATFPSGGGTTSATNSIAFSIGASDATTNRLNGYVADVAVGRIAATTAQLAALRSLEKAFYPALP